MKLQPRKELLASDNSGLLLYYPQLRTNDFVSFFFATPQPPRLRHARLKTVTPPPNRDDGDAGTKNREKISHALLAVEEKLCWFPSDAKEAKK